RYRLSVLRGHARLGVGLAQGRTVTVPHLLHINNNPKYGAANARSLQLLRILTRASPKLMRMASLALLCATVFPQEVHHCLDVISHSTRRIFRLPSKLLRQCQRRAALIIDDIGSGTGP